MKVRIIYMTKNSQTVICEGFAPKSFKRCFNATTFEVSDKQMAEIEQAVGKSNVVCDF